MAEKQVSAHKGVGPLYSNERGYLKLEYDFSKDGGASADTYVMGTAGEKMVVLATTVYVAEAVTSGGAATVQIGVQGGDADAILPDTAVGSLTAEAVLEDAAGQKFVIQKGEKIEAVVGTADLTAGRICVYIEYVNAG